ncbi:MAG: beta-ketoacyl-ACP synthase [Gammaproteobacteria bacterium]
MTSPGLHLTLPLPITAYSASCAAGIGTEKLYDALLSSQTCLQTPSLISTDFLTYTGEIADALLPTLDATLQSYSSRNAQIALATLNHTQDNLRGTIEAAVERYGANRIAVVIGTSTSGIYETENCYIEIEKNQQMPEIFDFINQHIWSATANFLKLELGLSGPCYAISTACSSSSKTLACAQRLITTGLCDAVLTGGVDSLCRLTLQGFKSLDILSKAPCTPLDKNRCGISIGEGAGLLFLERHHNDHAACVHLLGCGESSDAYHMTAPHPEGRGAIAAMQGALKQAGIASEEIDYINLHATGTVLNDQSEMRAVHSAFGSDIHCSGTKGLIGHTLGAAGGIESIIGLLCLQKRFRPGTSGLIESDPLFKCAIIQNTETDVSINAVMNNNFGFGGNNTSLILGWHHE